MSNKLRKQNYTTILCQLCVFSILAIFFLRICPVIPYDGDDWYFAGAMRWPFPLWGVFNPTKVLPETIEPFCGYIAAYIVYPITGDYVASLSYTMGFCIACISFAFCFSLYMYLIRKIKVSNHKALAVEFIILLSLFLVFKQRTSESFYALWSSDVNCCFNYVVPGLINGITVFVLEIYSSLEKDRRNTIRSGALLIGVYFSVFSNIELSIIIAVYAGVKILEYILTTNSNWNKVIHKGLFTDNKWYWGILLTWLISLVYELNGGRARVLSNSSFWAQGFKDTIRQMIAFAKNINPIFGALAIITIVAAIILSTIGSAKGNEFDKVIRNTLRKSIFTGIIISIYLLLLFTKLGGGYASRPDCMWAIQFAAYWILAISLAEVITKCKAIRMVIPLCVILMTISTFNINNPYISSHGGRDYATCKAIDDYIIEQIVEADRNGQSYVEVRVPLEQSNDNWPHPYNMAHWMQNTLYAHGITHRRMTIVFVPDPSVNEMFYSCDGIPMEPFRDLEAW